MAKMPAGTYRVRASFRSVPERGDFPCLARSPPASSGRSSRPVAKTSSPGSVSRSCCRDLLATEPSRRRTMTDNLLALINAQQDANQYSKASCQARRAQHGQNRPDFADLVSASRGTSPLPLHPLPPPFQGRRADRENQQTRLRQLIRLDCIRVSGDGICPFDNRRNNPGRSRAGYMMAGRAAGRLVHAECRAVAVRCGPLARSVG